MATTTAPLFARSSRKARLAAIAFLSLAPLTHCMCADVQRNRAFRRHLNARIDDYVHLASAEVLSRQVRELVNAEGCTLHHWDGRSRTTTDWDTHDKSRERYHVEVRERAVGHVVRLTKQTQRLAEPEWERKERRRDHDLERAVLLRVYPERADGMTTERVGKYVYDIAPAVLWDAARQEMHERGETLTNAHRVPIDVTAEANWVVYDGEDPSRVRHELSIVRLSDSAHRLEVHRTLDRSVGPRRWETSSEQRDYPLELRLIERRDPAAAEDMRAEARQKGEEAYRRARERGAASCNA